MNEKYQEDILEMLKALADESRLELLRILHEKEWNVGDLARQVDLTEPTVSHHLARLRETGFVTLRMDGNLRYYRANASSLARFKRLAEQIEQRPSQPEPSDNRWIDDLGWEVEDAQVLRDYTRNGVLTHLPNKRKKTLVILRWLATRFELGREYTEAGVNEVLKAAYPLDYVSLRRDLIDVGALKREAGGSKYWRVDKEITQ